MFKYGLFVVLVLSCAINECLLKEIPSYIESCKRDQNTIDKCVWNAIEKLRPKLAEGIPELHVPSLDPFIIPEIKMTTNEQNIRAVGKDVKVTGAGNFHIKNISVDLERLTIRGRVRFPKLHLDGQYKVDAQVLVLPIRGEGNLLADAVKADADVTLYSNYFEKDGVDYVKFNKIDMDISVKDYHMRLDGLFNGDKALGDATNEVINQNRFEFLKASKPYLERAVGKILLEAANKVVDDIPFDTLLPKS